jgi:hypothetical protein
MWPLGRLGVDQKKVLEFILGKYIVSMEIKVKWLRAGKP